MSSDDTSAVSRETWRDRVAEGIARRLGIDTPFGEMSGQGREIFRAIAAAAVAALEEERERELGKGERG